MTKERAYEIINLYEYWIDRACTCFQGHAPCGKCELMPTYEDYEIALKLTIND